MTDPLEYLIDEGFAVIYYWTEDSGKNPLKGQILCFDSEIIQKIKADGEKKTISIDGVSYAINNQFYEKYGTTVLDKTSAAQLMKDSFAKYAEIEEEFSQIDPKIL